MNMPKMKHLRLIIMLISLFLVGSLLIQAQTEDPNLNELVNGNNTFAFDLYQQIRAEDGNLFYSPYSISQALAMVYAGSRNQTELQMADVLSFNLPQADLHPTFSNLQADLNNRATEDDIADDQRFQLSIANALWGQVNFPFISQYFDLLAQNYEAGLQLVDFTADPETARQMVNDWVAENTEDRIQDIVPQGGVTPATRLILANAIYFNAGWLNTFEEAFTTDAPFTLLDNSKVTVPMMQQQEIFMYIDAEGYQAIQIPYVGFDTSMTLIMPDAGNFEAFEATLDAQVYSDINAVLDPQELIFSMPKFEFEYDLGLSSHLVTMGMTDAFSESAADFSGMANLTDTSENLFISDVLHKAFIKVDEAGTEAAAATVVLMEITSALPIEPIEVKIDRPFIFTINDLQTGSVLFVGRVINPS